MKENYSVLMSVYLKDNLLYLKESIESILNQTILTNDFVIVKDGPLTDEMNNVLDDYKNKYSFINIINLEKNMGLGKALNEGLMHCKNELVARMDADDYSFKDRIEKQLNYMKKEKIDLLGTQAIEFIDDINKPVQYNKFPLNHDDIVNYAHKRNPYAHPSVIFNKKAVLKAGGYREAYLCEDYDLWIRMIMSGSKCANLDNYLFAVRVNNDFYKRRGGIKYVKSINNLMIMNMQNGFFTKKDYFKNMIIRTIVYLMPNKLREFFYKTFLRKDSKNAN